MAPSLSTSKTFVIESFGEILLNPASYNIVLGSPPFNESGTFLVVQHLYPEESIPSHIIVAASGVEDEEIADAYHSKLRDGEQMKVLGGGLISIDHTKLQISISGNSQVFGAYNKSMAEKILNSSFEDYIISIEQ